MPDKPVSLGKEEKLWEIDTPGIPDDLFERQDNVPITKEDIRALVISKLRLKKGYSVIDIGCGSGSITVELCIQTGNGRIFAIDQTDEAVQLTKKNLEKFNRKAEVIKSAAQDILPSLPQVDAIVIGGTWGDTGRIISMSLDRLKKGGRLVVDTILIETMYNAINHLSQIGVEAEITQVTIAKSRKVTTGTMMLARNPVLLISATKN